ncbi:MAG: protein kinase [Acidobacteriaceae bacterium]|nr:protein kinase [Acidobacteriaceae bacterium]MBV9499289.1 protein kinase [Acidobacteriaceae bacterium]
MPLEVGQVASDYEILGLLGKGGMGRVFRVRNVISNRVEAMKVLLADVAAEEQLSDRFIGEIRTLARLDHPNIAKFHTAFKYENQLVMVMEFVEGFTLSDRASQGRIPLDEVLSYVTQTLAALSYAHQNGVIHRDIKPSNIMVTPHGVVKLMDFGIAKSSADASLTRTGTTMGSMLYMSPEQVRGTAVDARSDLYSVGVLLYELTAGRRPFEAESTYAILEAQLNTMPRPPIELNQALPRPLNDIIMTALAKEPMQRFQSAEAFRKALETVRGRNHMAVAEGPAGAEVAADTLPMRPSPPPPAKSGTRGLWMAIGAVACVCVLAVGALTLPHFWKSSAATNAAPHQAPRQSEPAPIVPTSASRPQPPEQQNQGRPAQQAPAVPADSAGPSATSQPPATSPTSTPVHRQPSARSQVAQQRPRPSGPAVANQPSSAAESVAVSAPSAPAPSVSAPPQPSAQEMDAASEDLVKLHARAEAVKDSLDNLRRQQAQDGFGIRQDIASAATRLNIYLQTADGALQSNALDNARKNMARAEEELDKLEKFFGK